MIFAKVTENMEDISGTKKALSLIRLSVNSRHDAFLTEPMVQMTSNGEFMLCHCGDRVNVMCCATGQKKHALETKDDPLYTLRLGPNEEVLVTSHTSGLLRHWDWKNNELKRVWKSLHVGPIPALSVDATSTLVASGGVDGAIKVWDIVRQYCTHSLKGSVGVISAMEFYQDEKQIHLLGAGDDSVIRCWDLTTSEVLHEMRGHFSKITSLCINKVGGQLISCSRDKVLMLWDLADGSLIRTVATHEAMEGAALVPADATLAGHRCSGAAHVLTVGERGVLRLWNMATSQCVYKQEDPSGAPSTICQISCSPTSHLITVVNHEHNILVYKIDTMELKHQYVGFSDEILDIVFCGEKESHIAVATNSPVIKVYDVSNFNCVLVRGHSDTVLSLAVSPSNKDVFASSSKDDSVRLWQLSDEQEVVCLAVGSGHTGSVSAVCWSQQTANFLLSGAEDKCIKLWDIPSKLQRQSSPVTLHCRRTEIAHEKDVNSVAVSPNDRLVATASQDKTARLYTTDGLSLLGVFRGHRRGVWAITFSSVDQVVATASADCSVKLWSISDFSCLKTFEGHDSSVLRVAFLCRGMQLLTCSADGLLKLWSVKANECLQTLSEHDAKVWALAVSSDEQRFVSGGADSTLLFWRDVHEEEAAATAEAAALRATQEQALANLVQQKQWLRALKLAIKLRRPFRCLQILKEVRREEDHEASLTSILSQLRDDQLDELLQFAVEWNTNSKHCHEAQLVVSLALRLRSPDSWRQLPSCRQLLEGLLPYTERHLERLSRLQQSVAFLDYTAACMKVTAQPGTDTSVDVAPWDVETDETPAASQLETNSPVKDEVKQEDESEGNDVERSGPEPQSEDSGLEAEEPPAKVAKTKRSLAKKTPPKKVKKKQRVNS